MLIYPRSLFFQILHVLSVLIAAPFCFFTFPFKISTRFYFISQWARFNLWMLKVICGLNYRVTGLENIQAAPGIIMIKHASTFETLVIQVIFPDQAWILKQELLKVPFFGWGLRMLEPIAINRSAKHSAIKIMVEEGKQKLKQGRWLIIFPEGTRIPAGQVGRYGIGSMIVAQQTQAPITPVAHNAGYFWPRQGFLIYPGIVDIKIGAPIKTLDVDSQTLKNEVQDCIEGMVKKLPAPSRSFTK